jgi:membrane-associated phospholipid phosphatase
VSDPAAHCSHRHGPLEWRLVGKVNFRFAAAIGIAMAVVTVLVANHDHLPVRDPDDDIWPAYIRLPAMMLAALAVDVLPRAIWRSRRAWRDFAGATREVFVERWPLSQVWFALSGVATWYLSYAAFRDLKAYVPFVNQKVWDPTLAHIDRILWFGHDPAQVLHHVFGTGFMAEVFSCIYVAWIVMIPVSIAIALIFTRNRRAGQWYVTALSVDWALGVAGYFMFPTLGPVYSDPSTFSGLQHTYVTHLQAGLLGDRIAYLQHPFHTDAVQTIAAFPSLHVGMMVTVMLCLEFFGVRRWLRIAGRIGLVLTVLATVYLGWHFFTDSLGGIVVGSLGVWIAALGTGNHVGLRPVLRRDPEPVDKTQPAASPSRLA